MKRLVGATALILAVAACGGSDSEPSPTAADGTTTTVAAETTTTTDASSDTTAPDDTTTSTAAAPGRAVFTITEVGLGSLSQVFVENVGDAPGSLAGHWLCQRPAYSELPDVELQPGEVAQIYVSGRDNDVFGPRDGAIVVEGPATIGTLDPADGEVGLYSSNSFGSSSDIVSYVEWGSSGHGRSDTAVAAGIWTEGFVPTTADSGAILATRIPPTDPSHWTGG